MARTRKVQMSFNAGMISSQLDGRLDLFQAQQGVRTMRNMIAVREGGAIRRPGLRFIGSVKGQGLDEVTGTGNQPGDGLWQSSDHWDDPLSDNFVDGVWSLLIEHAGANDYNYTFAGTMSSNADLSPWQMRFNKSGSPTAAPIYVYLDYLGNVLFGSKTGTIEITDPAAFTFHVHMGDPTVGFSVAGGSITAQALFLLPP